MIKFKSIIFSLFITLVLISCNDEAKNDANNINVNGVPNIPTVSNVLPPVGLPPSQDEINKIMSSSSKFFDTLLVRNNFSGGFLVAENGHILFEKYRGTNRYPTGETITENTPLHIASTSKTFTAMAVLRLMELGFLKLDDSVSKYIPNFNYNGVTIKTLLNHRSGLPNYLYFMEAMHWDPKKYCSNKDVLDILINKKDSLFDIFTPDTKFNYNNTNYALLALIIEKITKRSFPDFLQEQFFGPLHMPNSYVFQPKDSLRATPSYFNNGRQYPTNCLDYVYGDKNVYTTVKDLFNWDQALKGGKLFKKETLEMAYTGYSNEKKGIKNYGFGWRMNNYENGKKAIFHNGWWHGSNSVFWRLLDEDATIICVGNKYNRAIYDASQLSFLFGKYGDFHDIEEADPNSNATQIIKSFNYDSVKKVLIKNKVANWKDSLERLQKQPLIEAKENLKQKKKLTEIFRDANPR